MKDSTEIILEGSRFWFQKVLVPIMVCIGVTGNTVTVMVLTRRRMRSSTNIYLSALAIADIIHLFFVFLLSFKHYNNINDRKYELYWRFYGLSHWLCDAASSTSVWLTVSFTIERYIAVCHPMKGKYFCTENRAKTVIVIVYIFCILTTASTTFEYQLSMNDMENCTECKIDTKKLTSEDAVTNLSADSVGLARHATTHFVPNNIILAKENTSDSNQNLSTIKVFNDPHLTTVLKNILSNCTTNHPHIIYVYPQLLNITEQKTRNGRGKIETLSNMTIIHNYLNDVEQKEDKDENYSTVDALRVGGEANNSTAVTIKHCCTKRLWIDVESTNLGKNETYTSFMYWYSALFFGLFPLVLIATFNCFLIRAVYISQKKRRAMTNSKKIKSQDSVSSHNENRITLMLISVVVMFLICQTPTASFLIYSNFYPPTTPSKKNIHNTLGNVFNFLITVNASCNFLLYSTMSKKFRSTFKKLFLERGKNKRQDTIVMSSTKSNSQKFNPYHHGIKRNPTEYHTPRNLETQSLTSVPRSKSMMVRPMGKAKSIDLIV